MKSTKTYKFNYADPYALFDEEDPENVGNVIPSADPYPLLEVPLSPRIISENQSQASEVIETFTPIRGSTLQQIISENLETR